MKFLSSQRRAALLFSFASVGLTGCPAGGNTATGGGGGGSGGGTSTGCAAGEIVCEGNVARVCDGKGGFSGETDCLDQACAEGVGCGPCALGTGSCADGVGEACGGDGRFFTFEGPQYIWNGFGTG